MRCRWLALAALVLVACDTPPLTLRIRLTDGDAQQCISSENGNATTDCSKINMICDGVLSLRIVPPNQPEVPYVYMCTDLVGQPDLCSIAGPSLEQAMVPVPEQVLEIQLAVFERTSLEKDADGNYICPRVEFAANNLPETADTCFESDPSLCPARPAVGGRAYYYPGDEKTVVELGCTDLSLLNGPACVGTNLIDVTATVNDFDTWVPVSATAAQRLTVSIGEPRADLSNLYTLTGTQPLAGPSSNVPPSWSSALDFSPESYYCVEVFEDIPQATRALVCRAITGKESTEGIKMTGALLSKDTLDDVLTALGKPSFPITGLVVGVVLDEFNRPMSGVKVSAVCGPSETCTVQYLSADRTALTSDTTSANGIWISQDAPFGTLFQRSGTVQPTFGGLVQGKVTIVVLQESAMIGD